MNTDQLIVQNATDLLKSVSSKAVHFEDIDPDELSELKGLLQVPGVISSEEFAEVLEVEKCKGEESQGGYVWAELMETILPGGLQPSKASMPAMAFWASHTSDEGLKNKLFGGIGENLRQKYLDDPKRLYLEIPNPISAILRHSFVKDGINTIFDSVTPHMMTEGGTSKEKELFCAVLLSALQYDKEAVTRLPSIVKSCVSAGLIYPTDITDSAFYSRYSKEFSEETRDFIQSTVEAARDLATAGN